MKIKSFLILVVTSTCFLFSCKKDGPSIQLNFTNNVVVGTADVNGEYSITGHITSAVRLDSVNLTKQGESSPFLIDNATAKNKLDYTFSYLVTGITANTTIIIDVFDQNGGKIESTFLIDK
jgi:hypothetical protein